MCIGSAVDAEGESYECIGPHLGERGVAVSIAEALERALRRRRW
jgi:hypothetical protein